MVQKEEIVEPKIEKVEEKVVDIQEKKPQAVEEKVSVRGLFESVNARVEEIPVKQKKPTVRIQSKEKTQSSVAKDTVQNLNLDSVALVHVQSSGGKTTGEYDQYWGAISDILLQNWQITIETESGLNASVNITFDSSGKIVNFVITKLSYNNAFNAKFRSFLQKMRGFDFPKYDSNELRTYNFTFKDEYE